MGLQRRAGLAPRERHRHLGQQRAGRLGVRHHQLRLVDRHRPRRHADFGHPAALQTGLAHVDQPLCRGDDAVCRRLRRDLPARAHRPPVAGDLLAVPVPERDGPVAEFPQPAHLGRVRRLDLRHGVAALLVHRSHSRPRDVPRQDGTPGAEAPVRAAGDGLARIGAPLGALREGVPAARRAFRRRWCSRCTRS